jgi:hypothetical protein
MAGNDEWGIDYCGGKHMEGNIIYTVTTNSSDAQISNLTQTGWADALSGATLGTVYPAYGAYASGSNNSVIQYPALQYPAQTLTASAWEQTAMNYYYRLQNNYIANIMYSPVMTLDEWEATRDTPEARAERDKQRAEREAKTRAATLRAESLLFTILTPTQVKQYTDDDYFEVPVGERLYRLRKGRSMNVELMEAGKAKIKFCAHPSDAHDVPVPDVMLSQMLMLQSNEQEFLRIANQQVLQ